MLTLVTPAAASPPQPVTITVLTTLEPGAVDPFTSTGGVVCADGEVSTPSTLFVGGQSGTHAQLLIVKRFVCDTGSFDLLLRVSISFETFATKGTWSVMDGTGVFAKLHGSGRITGTNMGDQVLDEYKGSMHID